MNNPNKIHETIVNFTRFIVINLDTVLSIILAAIAAVLSTFGGEIEYVLAATAGVLIVLSIGTLRDRNARESLVQQIQNIRLEIKQFAGQMSADDFFSHKTNEQLIIVQAENEIFLLQETGRLIAETNRRDLVNFLRRGGRIRWVSVLDSPSIIELMAFRNANLITPQLMAGRMRSGFEMIEVLANEAGSNATQLEVRFFPYPTDLTAVFKDPNHVDHRKREALVRLQGFQVTFDDKLDFRINSYNSKEVYELFRQQMENIWHSSTKCIFLTGKPRVGKSTLLSKLVDIIRQSTDLKIVGFITHDIKNESGDRIAFETTTVDKLERGQLAVKKDKGYYELDHNTMEEIILPTLLTGVEEADLLVIDEVGPIQLQSTKFQNLINSVLEKRNISVIGIVASQGHPYLSKIHQHYRTGLIEVNELNRDQLVEKLAVEFMTRGKN
jgi:nucleoside-triphosphatase